ncbi:MAG: hypothetical protein KJ645_03605, partial [Planctomycetes bacterium]|nr:hypothetical protein [Planctomycetota bacterium]
MHSFPRITPLFFLILLIPFPNQARAQEDSMMSVAEKKDLPIEVELSGTFQAEDTTRVALEPEEFSGSLIIKTIVDEGISVKEGDLLIEFEVDELEKAITKAENGLDDKKVDLTKAQTELETLRIDQEVTLKRVNKEVELARNDVAGEQEKID